MSQEVVLNMKDVGKKYGENAVLKGVSLQVKAGEIHALLGENGAGKSTLMNILFGMSVIHSTGGYEGVVEISGSEVNFSSPNDAITAGIGMVHQEFMLIPAFSITENIKLGREDTTPTILSRVFGEYLERLDEKKMAEDSRRSLDSIGMGIEEHVKIAGLPIGYMQFIEIAREIDKLGIKLLVFDEPTAVLTESEATQLLSVMKSIAEKGIAIVFITHRLSEVMDVADSMTVLRDGELITSKSVSDTSISEIAELMVGRKIDNLGAHAKAQEAAEHAEIAVKVKDFYVDMPGEKVSGVSFEVKQGEIFGIGGMAGQGKVGIPNGISGLMPSEGHIEIFGEKLNLSKLGVAMEKGVAFVSEDRKGVGLLLEEDIAYNIMFRSMAIRKQFLGKSRLLSRHATHKHAEEMIKILDIRCRSWRQKSGTLSGGNQQKVCLASALTMNPRVLIVSEPTRGIDIGAKELILNYMAKLRDEEGLTIIMVSSELGELRSLCDRIAIVAEGKIVNILPPDAPDAEYGLAMSAIGKDQITNTLEADTEIDTVINLEIKIEAEGSE